jgi:hypothetical protein
MIRVADELVGGVFVGANQPDFSDAVPLYKITSPPAPCLVEVKIKSPRPYRYYRFSALAEYPFANISMLEFITDKRYGYANVHSATPPVALSPADTLRLHADNQQVKLLDAPLDEFVWHLAYDGNMQSAPSDSRDITLSLAEPQVVTAIRFAPLNADNGIVVGNFYQLMYWDGDGWRSGDVQEARYNYLDFTVPAGKLYWLHNLTQGQEELPFVMVGGEQRFLYYDVVK